MTPEFFDGTLEPAQPRSIKRGSARFDRLTIVAPSGQARTFEKVWTREPMSSEVIAGGKGRFCFARSDGALGLVGVKRPDGAATFAWFSNAAPIILAVAVFGILFGLVKLVFQIEGMPVTPGVLGVLLLGAGAFLTSQKNAARRAFEADTH